MHSPATQSILLSITATLHLLRNYLVHRYSRNAAIFLEDFFNINLNDLESIEISNEDPKRINLQHHIVLSSFLKWILNQVVPAINSLWVLTARLVTNLAQRHFCETGVVTMLLRLEPHWQVSSWSWASHTRDWLREALNTLHSTQCESSEELSTLYQLQSIYLMHDAAFISLFCLTNAYFYSSLF